MKNRILVLLVCLLTAVLFFTGCGEVKDINITDVKTDIVDKCDFKEMRELDENQMDKVCEIRKYCSEINYLISMNPTSSDELVILKVNKSEDTKTVMSQLQQHVDDRINIFSSYGPQEAKKLQDSVFVTKGNYLLFVAGDNADKAAKTFKDAFK